MSNEQEYAAVARLENAQEDKHHDASAEESESDTAWICRENWRTEEGRLFRDVAVTESHKFWGSEESVPTERQISSE